MVSMAAVHAWLCFKLVVHPLYSPDLAPSDYFYVPQYETALDWEAVSNRWGHICSIYRTCSRIRMRASIPRESKRCNTGGRSVWPDRGDYLEEKNLVKFDHCIIVNLWTFQPTLVILENFFFGVCIKCDLSWTAYLAIPLV